MTTIPTITVTPGAAANAYARIDRGEAAGGIPSGPGFGQTLQRALEGAVATGQQAETKAIQAITTGTGLSEVVTALSQAELTLQTATAVRDRVIQAYQDIIRMPI